MRIEFTKQDIRPAYCTVLKYVSDTYIICIMEHDNGERLMSVRQATGKERKDYEG
jgi:uncharacterized DUF497 family protein